MGRKNKKYRKTLKQQANMRLKAKTRFGVSKREYLRENEENPDAENLIFGIGTYTSYWESIKSFIEYIEEYHSQITTLDKCKPYIKEYLDKAEYDGQSAWSIQLYAKALNKLFDITPESSDYVEPPARKRSEIKRSRGEAARDANFSEKNNHVLVGFAKGTGLRRSELGWIRKDCLFKKDELKNTLRVLSDSDIESKFDEDASKVKFAIEDTDIFAEEYFVFVKGKGGRIRFAPVLDKNLSIVLEKFEQTTPGHKVWPTVNSNADIHSYRSDYANSIYLEYARPIEDIPKVVYVKDEHGNMKKELGIYYMRNDEKGKAYDRRAMLYCSKALGHNRVTVVAENYLRGI